jgi:hypothetical protein
MAKSRAVWAALSAQCETLWAVFDAAMALRR